MISIHATKEKEVTKIGELSDSEEENFQDVDRAVEEKKTASKAVKKEVSEKINAN